MTTGGLIQSAAKEGGAGAEIEAAVSDTISRKMKGRATLYKESEEPIVALVVLMKVKTSEGALL
jgi:hypothetical protein